MKTAPITVTEIALLGGVVVLGVLAYKAYSALPNFSIAGAVSGASDYVDARAPEQNPDEFSLGGVQQAVSDAVRRGQDAGATNFFSAYFTGLFK